MRNTILGLLMLALPAAGQKPAPKPEEPYTLSVNVDVVLFNLTVLDNKGHLVPGLGQKNFRIFEDGKPQDIRLFNAEDIPATVGLVIDNSGSMTAKIPDVISAATMFIHDSNPHDELFIVNFSDRVAFGLPHSMPFTSNLPQLESALMSIRALGRTALYDAVAAALSHLSQGTRQKKALVVLSDGGDNASHLVLKDVVNAAERSSATIYTIGIYDAYDRDRNPKVMHQLAKLTGGEAYFPRNTSQLEDIWKRIAGGIRSQYTIGYVSTNAARDGTFRTVKIDAVDERGKPLQVRTRKGYLAPK